MPAWKRVFGAEHENKEASGDKPGQRYAKILVPAYASPYSMRSLEVACRLARDSAASIVLAYVIEVPRALVLDAELPAEEALADEILEDGVAAIKPFKIPVESMVHRTRIARDGILSLIGREEIDLLVLGTRADGVRGLSSDLTKELFRQARCEVVVDYIAAEKVAL